MLRQTVNILEQQRILSRLTVIPRILVSNTGITTSTQHNAIPKFDWNPVKYNFNFQLLHAEYDNHCKKYNLTNKFIKERVQMLEHMQKSLAKKSLEQTQQIQSVSLLQTVVFNGEQTNSTLSASNNSEDKTIYEMAGKRAKQAKKKRSKRKNGGHQSIRC